MLQIAKYTLHDHQELKWLCLYSGVVGASTLTMVWFTQPYFKQAGLPLTYFGVVWALLQLTGAFHSWHAHTIERWLGKRRSLLLLVVLPVIGYFTLGSIGSLTAGIVIALFYVARGIHSPIVADYLNGLIESNIRATVLSVRNLLARLLFSVIGPIMGWVHDHTSLSFALHLSGALFLVLGSAALFGLVRAERRHQTTQTDIVR